MTSSPRSRRIHAYRHRAVWGSVQPSGCRPLAELLTDNTIFEDPSSPPDGRRIEGKAVVVEHWRGWFARNAGAVFDTEDMVVCDNRAVVRWVYRKMRDAHAAY